MLIIAVLREVVKKKKCKSADDNPKRYSFCGRFSGHGSLTTGFQGNLRNIIARSLFSTNFIKNFYKWYLLYLRATIQGVKLVWILLSFYSISSFLTNTMRKHFKWKLAFTSHTVGHSKLGKVSQREDYWPFSVNPLTPKISLVILLAVCYTILVMLVGRIWD